MKKYVRFRNENKVLIAFLIFILGMTCVLLSVIWKGPIVCFVAATMLISFLEYTVIKCPYCSTRPVTWSRPFPEICPHCGKKL